MHSGVYAKPYNGHFQPVYMFAQPQQPLSTELTHQQKNILLALQKGQPLTYKDGIVNADSQASQPLTQDSQLDLSVHLQDQFFQFTQDSQQPNLDAFCESLKPYSDPAHSFMLQRQQEYKSWRIDKLLLTLETECPINPAFT